RHPLPPTRASRHLLRLLVISAKPMPIRDRFKLPRLLPAVTLSHHQGRPELWIGPVLTTPGFSLIIGPIPFRRRKLRPARVLTPPLLRAGPTASLTIEAKQVHSLPFAPLRLPPKRGPKRPG